MTYLPCSQNFLDYATADRLSSREGARLPGTRMLVFAAVKLGFVARFGNNGKAVVANGEDHLVVLVEVTAIS